MEALPPDGIDVPKWGLCSQLTEVPGERVSAIMLNIAENIFRRSGADERSTILFSHKLAKSIALNFFVGQHQHIVTAVIHGD